MEQKVNHTIPALKQKFFSLIQENRYSEQYRYYMRLRFASLEAYMSRNSCHNYSSEIGEQFISDFIKTEISKNRHVKRWRPLLTRSTMPFAGAVLWRAIRRTPQHRHPVLKKRLMVTHPLYEKWQ